MRLPISTAEQLWLGGFQEIETAYDVESPALTPTLCAWLNADFELLRWLTSKGASPFSRDCSTGRSGFHWYARRLVFPGGYFKFTISDVFSDRDLTSQLMWDNSAWRDSCSCLCSIGGCQPVTIFLKFTFVYAGYPNIGKILFLLRQFWAKIPPPPGQVQTQLEAVLRFFAFHEARVRHVSSCCYHDPYGGEPSISPGKSVKSRFWRKEDSDVSNDDPTFLRDQEMIQRKMQDYRQRLRYCGCPQPDNVVCVIFRCVCPLAKRRWVRNPRRARPVRSLSI